MCLSLRFELLDFIIIDQFLLGLDLANVRKIWHLLIYRSLCHILTLLRTGIAWFATLYLITLSEFGRVYRT